jgi:[acyl-carrier-protein] S-malonyltransferase
MAPIQEEWNRAVETAKFSSTQIPVIGNVQAGPLTDTNSARADIIAQMQSRVRWTESVQFMSVNGINTFVEAGTGTVLGGLVKRIVDGAAIFPLGNPQDFESIRD